MLTKGQASPSKKLYNVNAVYIFVLLTTPWFSYNCKAIATYKCMVVLIRGMFRNNYFFGKGKVGGAFNILNHIIKLLYNLNER